MSIKSKGRTLGRMVRRITGLPLPICMRIGKKVAQGTGEHDLVKMFPEITMKGEHCGDKCCYITTYTLNGPNGSIVSEWYFGEQAITKEYRVTVALRKVPMGTAVNAKTGKVVGMENVPDTVRTPPPVMS